MRKENEGDECLEGESQQRSTVARGLKEVENESGEGKEREKLRGDRKMPGGRCGEVRRWRVAKVEGNRLNRMGVSEGKGTRG